MIIINITRFTHWFMLYIEKYDPPCQVIRKSLNDRKESADSARDGDNKIKAVWYLAASSGEVM